MPTPWLLPRFRHLTLRLPAPVPAESTSEHTVRGAVLLTEGYYYDHGQIDVKAG
jgi:hypothetical protein